MKKILLVSAVLALAQAAFPQGQIQFDNRANTTGSPGTFPGAVIAPFYNVDPNCPTCIKKGNTSAGIPAGNQTYGGSLLAGSGYIATLYARNSTTVQGADDA